MNKSNLLSLYLCMFVVISIYTTIPSTISQRNTYLFCLISCDKEFRTRNFHRLIQQTWNILKLILCEKYLLQIDFIRKQEEKNVKSNKDSDTTFCTQQKRGLLHTNFCTQQDIISDYI